VAKLTLRQCKTTVFIYFLREGWLPSGTTNKTWSTVKMGDIDFDDPPLPADSDFQKRKVGMDLQVIFLNLGSHLPHPLDILSDKSSTLGDLAQWCFDNQV
jgi:hypothetical protein